MTDDGKSRALTRREFDSVMKRASELAMSDPAAGEGLLDEAEVFRIAREVGIPDAHVRRALVDVRSADVPVTMVDRWFGNADICVSRIVSGQREQIADTLDEFLVVGHLLQPIRRGNEVLLYRPAVGWLSSFARAGASMSEKAYWASAKEFKVQLRQVDDENLVVEFIVDPGIRGELVVGGIVGGVVAGGGVGFGLGVLLSSLAVAPVLMVSAVVAGAAAVGGGVVWATGWTSKRQRREVKQELEGVLDALERGDQLNPPPASWRRWVKRQADRFKVELFGSGSTSE
jgi:hypothetical protein